MNGAPKGFIAILRLEMHCSRSVGVEATSQPAERVRDSRASRMDAARGGAEQERIDTGPSGIVKE
jgi:hypothetical protein